MKVNPNYLGRLFTEKELTEQERQQAVRLPAMRKEKGKLFCQRCNSLILEEWYLPIGAYYCRECLLMKRVRSDQALYYFPQEDFPKQDVLKWRGQLTPFQEKVVSSPPVVLLYTIFRRRIFLNRMFLNGVVN